MRCRAEGTPDPQIIWLKDFIPVDITDPRFTVQPTGKARQYVLMSGQILRFSQPGGSLSKQTFNLSLFEIILKNKF